MNSWMDPAERAKALKAIWAATHRDFKGTFAGGKTVMIMRDGSTRLVRLSDLTDAEIAARLPKKG
jgi:hypothetical protein